jgi:hypothetical protein
LGGIDRTYPGFGDFDVAATRAIDPGRLDRSPLYHALASPTVVVDGNGDELRGLPTIARLRQRAADDRGAAPSRLPGASSAAPCSRCTTRLGTIEPLYDARARNFTGVDEARPFDFRVGPRRFAAYVAVQMIGGTDQFGPQDPLQGDDKLEFWGADPRGALQL